MSTDPASRLTTAGILSSTPHDPYKDKQLGKRGGGVLKLGCTQHPFTLCLKGFISLLYFSLWTYNVKVQQIVCGSLWKKVSTNMPLNSFYPLFVHITV